MMNSLRDSIIASNLCLYVATAGALLFVQVGPGPAPERRCVLGHLAHALVPVCFELFRLLLRDSIGESEDAGEIAMMRSSLPSSS